MYNHTHSVEFKQFAPEGISATPEVGRGSSLCEKSKYKISSIPGGGGYSQIFLEIEKLRSNINFKKESLKFHLNLSFIM